MTSRSSPSSESFIPEVVGDHTPMRTSSSSVRGDTQRRCAPQSAESVQRFSLEVSVGEFSAADERALEGRSTESVGRHRSVGAEAARKHAWEEPLDTCSAAVQQLAG